MDPVTLIGLLGSIVGLLQFAQPLYSQLGISEKDDKELKRLKSVLERFQFIYTHQKATVQAFQFDEHQETIRRYLGYPLTECQNVVKVLQLRLEKANFFSRYVIGKRWDKSFKKCVDRLEEAEKLYRLILQGNQYALLQSIDKYAGSSADALEVIKTGVVDLSDDLAEINEDTKSKLQELADMLQDFQMEAVSSEQNSKDIKVSLAQLHSSMISSMAREEAREERELRDSMVRWLRVTDYIANHTAARNQHTPGTASLFWLHGMAGCGKTILTSSIVEKTRAFCEESSRHHLAYFYFSFSEVSKQDISSFLCCVISQLLDQIRIIPLSLRTLYKDYKGGVPPISQLELAVGDIIRYNDEREHDDIFLIIDALDEVPEIKSRNVFCRMLQYLERYSRLHILFTSRRERDIEQAMLNCCRGFEISLESRLLEDDIEFFINVELQDLELFKSLEKSFQEEIQDILKNGAKGMFRWVTLHIDALKECFSISDIQATLEQMPETLDETYERILARVPKRYYQSVISALRWLAFSVRPLEIAELAEAAVFRVPFNISDRFQDQRDILRLLSGFVLVTTQRNDEFDSSDGGHSHEVIQLAHYSVKEYLISDRLRACSQARFAIETMESHSIITMSCLDYMRYIAEDNCYESLRSSTPSLFDWNRYSSLHFPLLTYASEKWYYHAKIVASDQVKTHIYQFLTASLPFEFWRNWRSLRTKKIDLTPLIAAVRLRLDEICHYLIESGYVMNSKGYDKEIVRHYLLSDDGGPFDISLVQLFIDHGANVNCRALGLALDHKRFDILRLLLEQGADPNLRNTADAPLLHRAIGFGEMTVELTNLLLDFGAEINCTAGQDQTVLYESVDTVNIPLVELLLNRGADINALGGHYGTALQAASAQNNLVLVEKLLDRGADVNASGGHYGTALQAASAEGDLVLVEKLLDRGADVNASGGYYGTALQAASAQNSLVLVEKLLDRGADVNASGGYFSTALHAACSAFTDFSRHPNPKVVRLLLDHGADVKARCTRCNRRPLDSLLYSISSFLSKPDLEDFITCATLILQKGARLGNEGETNLSILTSDTYVNNTTSEDDFRLSAERLIEREVQNELLILDSNAEQVHVGGINMLELLTR